MSDWTEAEISRLYQTRQENPKTIPFDFDSDEIFEDNLDVSQDNETPDEEDELDESSDD